MEAAGIEPASRSHSGPSIYACVPRFGSRSSAAHGRAAAEPASLVLAGAPRGAATRPARCWRPPQAAGAPAENGYLETRQRENSCWQVSAVPRGLTGTSDPRRAARISAKPVETSAPPCCGENIAGAGDLCEGRWLGNGCSSKRARAHPAPGTRERDPGDGSLPDQCAPPTGFWGIRAARAAASASPS